MAVRSRSLVLGLLSATLLLACSSGSAHRPDAPSAKKKSGSSQAGSASDMFGNAVPVDGGGKATDAGGLDMELTLTPDTPMLDVEHGKDGTLQFTVKNSAGAPVAANYSVDDEDFGSIDANGLFTASGTQAGTTVIEARVGQRVLRTMITITIHWEQNGATPDPMSAQASGGYGGVGGEGPGPAVSDALKKVLDGTPQSDSAKFLYPYDLTVFPLGLLSPLLMWSEGSAAAADAIALHIHGDTFDYRGYFGRPSALASGASFVRHPIPQEVWDAATRSVAGAGFTIELTLAKGGTAYGPITETLKIAAGTLKGTVYYQSYGTRLAKNLTGAVGGDGRFGGATLAIKPGALGPALVAGSDGDMSKCRVCHSVSSDGSRMTVEHGDNYAMTSSYDLRNGNKETPYAADRSGLLAWIGMTPDGAYGLGNSEPMGVNGEPQTQLYDMSDGSMVATQGLIDFVKLAALPMFSPDGQHVAFNFYNGPGDATIGAGDTKKLVMMDYDAMTKSFGNPQLLWKGDLCPGWPTFSPTGNSVMYEIELKRGKENKFFFTRYGGEGELWWTNLTTGMSHKLEQANGTQSGTAYLPSLTTVHEHDELLNYEPTIAPVASGGYVWMVFTSRRMYGNLATIDPWFSDPREHDLTSTPTTKKLWVAAIDLDVHTQEFNFMVGDDPSHPAFYLPGQELLAGNTRGFWTVDPCKADGMSCDSGVECCGGYCQKDDQTGTKTCGRKKYQCSAEFDYCDKPADCCDPMAVCVNHVCSMFKVE